MAADDELVERVRQLLDGEPGLSEKRMFGGHAFLLDGHMAVAASSKGGVMVRIDPAQCEALVAESGVRRMVMNGREMDGWLRVDTDALDGPALERWVEIGSDSARSLEH